jgi:hypothetical protein
MSNALPMKERLKINDFLAGIMEKGNNGNSRYKPGWTDQDAAERLTTMLGRPVTLGNVKGVRIQMFGHCRKRGAGKPEPRPGSAVDRIDALERRLEALERELGVSK